MKNELVSVVVPIYNVEKYLEKCIESLISQTYKNIEILLIDDGSNDSSGTICDYYAKKLDFIHVFHKENGGLSDARNFGIRKSSGKYLMFIDSDDYIDYNFVEKMVNKLINTNSDICSSAKIYEYSNKTIVVNNKEDFTLTAKEALKKMLLRDDIDNSVCDKIFKKDLFKNITFPVGKYYEDIGTTYKLMLNSKKITHITNSFYHYVMRDNSISNEIFSKKQLDSVLFSKEQMTNVLDEYPDLIDVCECNYYLEVVTVLRKINRATNKKEFEKENLSLSQELKKGLKKIRKNNFIPFYKKIMSYLAMFGFYHIIEIVYHLKKGV